MSAALPLREDFDADALHRLARAAIYDGGSRTDAARIGTVGLQTVRDRVLAFNAQRPAGLIDRTAPGTPPKLDAARRRALARAIEEGPDPDRHGVVRWRLKDPTAWIYASFGVSLDKSTVGRTVKALGLRKLTARPRHNEQDPAALTAFKTTSPPP